MSDTITCGTCGFVRANVGRVVPCPRCHGIPALWDVLRRLEALEADLARVERALAASPGRRAR